MALAGHDMDQAMDGLPADIQDQGSKPAVQGSRPAAWRRALAGVMLTACAVWPVWSAAEYHRFQMQGQQPYAQAMAGWQHLEQRFMPVRQALRPGTVLEYTASERVWVSPSRLNDVQFVITPLIIRRHAHMPLSPLILADKLNDEELLAYVQTHDLEVVHAWGSGLAVLRQPAAETKP